VWGIFVILLLLGYLQSRDRYIRGNSIWRFPVLMIILSLAGQLSSFGNAATGLVSWVAGAAAAVWSGSRLLQVRGVRFKPQDGIHFVPGSWLPLILMQAIFMVKYAVGILQARHYAIVSDAVFISCFSAIPGFLSGLFIVRTAQIVKAAGRIRDPEI